MLRNYFLVSLRSLFRNRTISLIHIIGFGFGIGVFLFAAQTVIFEYSFDTFYEKGNRIFEINHLVSSDGFEQRNTRIDPTIATRIAGNIPEIQYVARYMPQTLEESYCVITYTDRQGKQKTFNEPGAWYADEDFLKIFEFELIAGSRETLRNNSSLVMTRSCAKKYFGEDDPIGKTLELTTGGTESNKTNYSYQVGAILEDIPPNSSLQFDVLLPFRNFEDNYKQDIKNQWGWFESFHNFILTREVPENITKIEAKINDFLPAEIRKARQADGWSAQYKLQSLQRMHFDPDENKVPGIGRLQTTNKTFVIIVGIIGLVILVIAGVNYINLTTAKALERAKEVGIRKVVGAGKYQLMQQFMVDALLINVAGILLAFTLLQISKPLLAAWMGLGIPQISWWSYQSVIFFLALLVVTLASGIIPALILTKVKPLTILRGKVTNSPRGSMLRKGLVIFQFYVSVALIIFTYVLISQLMYMRSKDPGFDKGQRLVIHALGTEDFDFRKFRSFKERILRNKNVINASAGNSIPGSFRAGGPPFSSEDNPNNVMFISHLAVDYDFAKTLNIPMLAGGEFTEDLMTDERVAMLNETAVKAFSFGSPHDAIGKSINFYWQGEIKNLKIVGVTSDCNFLSPGAPAFPVVYFFANTGHPFPKYKHYVIQIAPGDFESTVSALEKEWHAVFPNAPFEFNFLDNMFQSVFEREEKMQSVASLSTLLAIFIACMGLGGLVTHSVNQRTKEIGIRKILGASVSKILFLLSRDFIILLLISTVIAMPLVWWVVSEFLANYAYRIEISFWIFIIPSMALLIISILIISFQTIRAANANPANTLKCE